MALAASRFTATTALNVERAVTAGSVSAFCTILFGWVWVQGIPTFFRWFGLDLGEWGPAELYAVGGFQVLAMSFHETVEIANGILGLLMTLLIGGFILGIPFGMYRQRFHGNVEWAGVYWGIGLWLIAQIVSVPLLGFMIEPSPGFFSLGAGIEAPIGSLLSHVMFGLVLGAIYEPHHDVIE